MKKTAIIIIAGGGAKRMDGADKPLLNLGETTILEHIHTRLKPQGHGLALNVPQDRVERYGAYTHLFDDVLHDSKHAPATPVAGIMAGLIWAQRMGAEQLLTWPGDSPFPPLDLAQRLQDARPLRGAAAPHDGTRLQVLASLWPVIDPATLHDCQSVHRALETVGFEEVDYADQADGFANINTAADLTRLKRKTPR